MKKYGLRKINIDGKNGYNDFVWPLEVGAEVVCPDWSPELECGNGLHCLENGQGDWELLDGYYWAVLEYDSADRVNIDDQKAKVSKCKIVFLSESPEGLLKFFDWKSFDSETAYEWARNIGNKDIMINRITESEWAYHWAVSIGNKDIMIDRITESGWAYEWAKNIGNKDKMIDRITKSHWAYWWAVNIGDFHEMLVKFPQINVMIATRGYSF